ncbi:MAG: DMT family transporter [Gammaproteobacteria bacterium]|nr:DMT family transporter [Gammaproteobacteria bacterium]
MTFRDSVELIILAFVWGGSFLFMRIAGPEFGPVALVELRVAIAVMVLLPILMTRSDLGELRANWKTLTLLGALNSAAPFLLLTYSTLYISGGLASILNATAPMFAAIIAWLWLADTLNGSRIAGLVIGFGGVYLLVWDKMSFVLGNTTLAILAAILASALYGFGGNYAKKYARRIKPLAIATGSQLAAAILLLPGAIVAWPKETVSPAAWLSIILMGVFSSGLAYILYFRLIASAGPTNAIMVTYLVPAFAMALGAIFIDEVVTVTMLVGCAIILFGTALATGMLVLPRGRF